MKIKICHITSAHGKEDIRIFKKECVSLAKIPEYDVYLVQEGNTYEKQGVKVVGFGNKETNRFKRIIQTAKRAFKKALSVDADIYQIHDPELLPYAKKLKKLGKIVIFDSHEFNLGTIREKYYLPKIVRIPLAFAYKWYETKVVRKLDGVISVSPDVCEYFASINRNTVQVANFPLLEPFVMPDYNSKEICFFGGITPEWNHSAIIDLLPEFPEVKYKIGGPVSPKEYLDELSGKPGWTQVDYKGRIPYEQVLKEMADCCIGVAILTPCLNTAGMRGTLGNTKIFEEMMAGLPVICTNFLLWKDIIDRYECGFLVDPTDKAQISSVIKTLVDNPDLCKKMGMNGRRAVEIEYSWDKDEKTLYEFYSQLCKKLKK